MTLSDFSLPIEALTCSTMLEPLLDAVILINESQQIVLFNQAAERIFQYQAADIIGQPLSILLPPHLQKHHEQLVEQYRQSGESNRPKGIFGRVKGLRQNGEEFPADASIARISFEGQTYFFAILRDTSAQQLSDSLQLLDAVFDDTHMMIAVLDTDMNFIRVNQAYAAQENNQPVDFIGKNHFALYPNAENETIFRQTVQTGNVVSYKAKPFTYENNPEREVTHWDWTLTPVKNSQGQVTCLVLSLLDVSERINAIEALNKRTQELHALNETLEQRVRLRAQELASFNQFTETLFDTVGSLIVVLDKQGHIVRFNHACEQTTGYKAEEVLGRIFWDFLIIPEERESVIETFEKLRAGQFPTTHEYYWLTKDGGKRWISWTNSAMVDNQGNVDFIICTGMDTTERRLAESGLRQSEKQFRLLAENISDVFWLISPDRKILYYISPAYEKIWGRPVTELYANPWSFVETIHPDDRHIITDDQTRQDNGNYKNDYEQEFRIYRPDGELRWITSHYVPIMDEKGEIFRLAGISKDITERKLAEQQRLQHERNQRDALVSEVHHRIKNNLQGVIGLLRQHINKNPQITEILEAAIIQVGTVALVHGLQSRHHGERVYLCELCETIAANITNTTGAAIKMQINRHSPTPYAIAIEEAVPLALVINELMFNAVKHTIDTDEGAITVDIEPRTRAVVVRMHNPGKGLPEGLDVMSGVSLGTGLTLVKTLIPNNATVTLRETNGEIETLLQISEPAIEILDSPDTTE